MKEIVEDLRAEQEALDAFLQTLSEDQWSLMTPAEGWTVKDSVAHIAHIDEVAVSILRGDDTPLKVAAKVTLGFNKIGLQKGEGMSPHEILHWWRSVRSILLEELLKCDPKARIPWFAQPMGARSFATARLMETWAHGLDCYDAVSVEPQDTDRLRHVALLAYLARLYAYRVHGLDIPVSPLRLELELPSGKIWSMGPEDAKEQVRGSAGAFCRVAVRRRHWRDTDLEVRGDEARRFLEIAQAYAGPPGPGRKPMMVE